MSTTQTPRPTRNPFEVPRMSKEQASKAVAAKAKKSAARKSKTLPADAYVTIWKDPESTRGGLLTYADGKKVAYRSEDEVARATNPTPTLLQDTPEDREYLDDWLRNPANTTRLAVPAALARDILGWTLDT
jgi:hypothetical protein